MKRRALRSGEALAMRASDIGHDADGFFFSFGPSAPDNEKRGTVAIVHIRGALSQFREDGGDSYEGILERVASALEDKPTTVVFRISSPGGVVAGLNETVLKLQQMSKAAKIDFVAYVDEMAASAAYAMCCACDEIFAPPSAVIGSVGVISTMVSQAKADEQMGIEFRLITSGARKADGHLHAPISDAAEAAERERNNDLAAQFFALAASARNMTPKKLAGLQAAIFLGDKAEKVGLINGVMSLDALLGSLDRAETPTPDAAPNEGNITDRRAKDVDNSSRHDSFMSKPTSLRDELRPHEVQMSVKLNAIIATTEAAIAGETDAKKKTKLVAKLATLQETRRLMGEDPDGGEDDDDDKDDDKSKKAAEKADRSAKKAEAAKHKAKADEHRAKAAESDEAAKKCMADDDGAESEEEAALGGAKISALSDGASAALAAQIAHSAKLEARLEAIEKRDIQKTTALAIEGALSGRRITPAEAKTLAKKDASFVTDFLSMRPKAIVMTDGEDEQVPDGTPGAHLGKEALAAIEEAVSGSSCQTPAEAKALRESLMAAHLQAATARANGAAPRY